MPIYEVHHSYPLTQKQKQALATTITDLHCHAFTTPRFFVHVIFHAHDASTLTYFLASKPQTTCTNRIVAQVRNSATRSKADFDALAQRIEFAWGDVLCGGDGVVGKDGEMAGAGDDEGKEKEKEKAKEDAAESEREAEAKRLLMISFYPMIAAREVGMMIPEAGDEGAWFREQIPYMKKMSEEKGLESFTDMLRELEEREDLKKLVS